MCVTVGMDDDATTTVDESTLTETVRDTQPRVKVGNARGGSGKLTLSPSRAYARAINQNFTITYEAAGPIYDYPGHAGDD